MLKSRIAFKTDSTLASADEKLNEPLPLSIEPRQVDVTNLFFSSSKYLTDYTEVKLLFPIPFSPSQMPFAI